MRRLRAAVPRPTAQRLEGGGTSGNRAPSTRPNSKAGAQRPRGTPSLTHGRQPNIHRLELQPQPQAGGPVDADEPTAMGTQYLLMLLALAGLWGASFMFIKIGVREIPPPTFVCLRFAIAALVLAPLVLLRLGSGVVTRTLRAEWAPLLLLDLVNSAIPITSLSWAETRIDSGLAAVLQAAAPLFTLLLALRFSRSDVVSGLRLTGLFLGFGGVALLVGAQPRGNIVAALAVSFSALCYVSFSLYGDH